MENEKQNNKMGTMVRNLVYKGDQTLFNMFEDINFALKWPIVEGRINQDQKEGLLECLNEMIDNLNKTPEQIKEDYDLEEDDFKYE